MTSTPHLRASLDSRAREACHETSEQVAEKALVGVIESEAKNAGIRNTKQIPRSCIGFGSSG